MTNSFKFVKVSAESINNDDCPLDTWYSSTRFVFSTLQEDTTSSAISSDEALTAPIMKKINSIDIMYVLEYLVSP